VTPRPTTSGTPRTLLSSPASASISSPRTASGAHPAARGACGAPGSPTSLLQGAVLEMFSPGQPAPAARRAPRLGAPPAPPAACRRCALPSPPRTGGLHGRSASSPTPTALSLTTKWQPA
jgi:hypothetical protein